MSNNNVAVISLMAKFDEKSVEQAAKKLGKTTEEALSDIGQDKFGENIVNEFNKAMDTIKKKLKGVNLSSYTNNVLDSLFSKKDIQEKTKDLQNFISNITNLSKSLSGLGNSALNSMSTKQLDSIISKQKKVLEKEEEIAKKRKELESTARNIGNKSRNPSTISKNYLQSDYEQSYKSLEKLFSTEKGFTSEQQKSIKYLSEMLTLYSDMGKTEPRKGTSESIKYASDLLTVVKEINKVSKDIDLFTNGKASKFVNKNFDSTKKINEYNPKLAQQDFIKAGLSTLNTQKAKLEKDLTDYVSRSVSKNLEKIANETGKVIDKTTAKSNKLQQKIETLQSLNNKPFINDIVDETQIKSLEEIEDRLYEIYDKDSEGEATNQELKEFIQLYKQYEQLISKDNTVKFDPELKTEYDYILKSSNSLQKYSNQLDNATNKNKEISHEVKETNKSIEDQNNSVNSYNNLESDLKEIKDAISGINEKINSIDNSSSFVNIETQLNVLDERVLSVSGHVDKLVESVNLLSSLSLSDIQKTTLPLYNGINEVFRANNGNRISGYWEDVKKEVEGSNVQLRELLKNVGLFNSESNGLKLISDGMENSGGIIGDDKVLIARKNHGKNYEEKLSLKQKLDEAYKSGINVSRILDVIGSKESDVIFDIQEKASGSILGNIYGQGEDFVNTEWLQASDEQIKKLISDLIELQNMGINVESNLTNIMYDKNKGFSFIDLDLNTTNFDNNAELMRDHMIRIFGDLEDFYIEKNDSLNADFVTKARKRFENLSEQVQRSYAEAQDSHSPSKDFENLEEDAVDGIVVGANKSEDKLKNVGKQMAENVKEGFSEGIKNIVVDGKFNSSITTLPSKESNASSDSNSAIEQQIKSESELNAEIEKRENIIRELQQLQEKLTVHEDFHGNDRYFADQLPTEEEIREADKRIKQLTGTNNIFDVDKLIQGRNEWLSEVKYSLEEYDDLIKANDQKALDEYTTRGLSRIGGAESFFGYEDNNFSIASKFVEEKEKIQNEINDLYVDLDKLDEKMNFDSNNSSVDNTVQSQEKLQSELKETQEQAEKTAQAVKEVASATASTEQTKDAFPKTSENLEQVVAQSEQKVQQEAVATDKALDNISFAPNTEGFDDIIAKFGILREQAEQITKIVKTTKQTADGTPDISYKATLKNGNSYYLGENSTPQVLNANETVYDSKIIEKAYQEATKVNNALNETNSLLNSLKVPNGFKGSFSTLESEIKQLNSEFGSGKISATEYANSIKKAFSNYQTPIDNRSKDIWNELTTSLNRYATLQKRIASNNALSTDNEEATKLLEHIHELQRSDILPTEKLTASNEKLQQINQTVTDLKAKLKESTLDSLQGSIDKYQKIYDQRSTYSSDFTPSEQYTKNLTELNTTIKNLVKYKNELKNVSEVTAEQEAELKGLVTACEKASDSFKALSASEKGASQIAVDKLVQRINKDLDENTNYSRQAKQGLKALREELESANPRNLKEIASDMINIENAEIRAGRAGRSFFDTLKNSGFHQLAAQMAGMFGFYDVINLGKEAVSTIVSLDDALVDLKKTTAMNETHLEDFYYDANDVAKQMGVTTEEIIPQASAWSRLGYNSQEAVTTMAKLSSKFASISPGMSTDEAQEGLVSIMKAFDIDPNDVETEIMDKVNVLGNKFAEENQDVIEGLKRSAAAMSAMGQSFTDTAALFTGGMEILQDSESMGTALRTLSMRVRGYDEETNQLSDDLVNVTGEVADLTKTAQDSQGVSLFTDATQKHYRSMVEYLGDIADRWDQISEKNQTELLQKLFGKNRANESVCPYVQKCA